MSHEVSAENGLKDLRFLAWRVGKKQQALHERTINKILSARPRQR